jgi:hypothetical protein
MNEWAPFGHFSSGGPLLSGPRISWRTKIENPLEDFPRGFFD